MEREDAFASTRTNSSAFANLWKVLDLPEQSWAVDVLSDSYQKRRVVVVDNLKLNEQIEGSIYVPNLDLVTGQYEMDLLVSKYYYPEVCHRFRLCDKVAVRISDPN